MVVRQERTDPEYRVRLQNVHVACLHMCVLRTSKRQYITYMNSACLMFAMYFTWQLQKFCKQIHKKRRVSSSVTISRVALAALRFSKVSPPFVIWIRRTWRSWKTLATWSARSVHAQRYLAVYVPSHVISASISHHCASRSRIACRNAKYVVPCAATLSNSPTIAGGNLTPLTRHTPFLPHSDSHRKYANSKFFRQILSNAAIIINISRLVLLSTRAMCFFQWTNTWH